MAKKDVLEIAEGRVYVNKDFNPAMRGREIKHRRIVGIVNGHVFYSIGGDVLRNCKLSTFARWARADITVT